MIPTNNKLGCLNMSYPKFAEIFSKLINGKSLNVNIVNPPIENPWRIKDDYTREQEEARERHAMFQEQHAIIQKSHRATVLAVVFSGIVALATCTLVYFSYQQIYILQEQTKQEPQAPKQILQNLSETDQSYKPPSLK